MLMLSINISLFPVFILFFFIHYLWDLIDGKHYN